MKRLLGVIFAFICVFSFAVLCFAHSGRTDSNGGHFDHSTGEYHYHHGYSAHSHINGECPYDFDDKTNHGNSVSNSSNKTTDYFERAVMSLIFSVLPALLLGLLTNSLYHYVTKKDLSDKIFDMLIIIFFILSTIVIFCLSLQY